MYGMAIEARTASTSEPFEKTTCSPVWKSVAVRKSGIFASSRRASPKACRRRSRTFRSSTRPNRSSKPKTRGRTAESRARVLRFAVISFVQSSRVLRSAVARSKPIATLAA